MEIHRIIADYNWFEERQISATYIDLKLLTAYIQRLPKDQFTVEIIGYSVKKKPIHKVQWGQGKTQVLLWGGMHGNEPTATAVFCDLCNYLQHPEFVKESEFLAKKITIHYIPAVNPDGVASFTRENAQGIDINRDFLNLESPEAQILKKIAEKINPNFAFNLHNQNTLWSAGKGGFPATLSFLAPSPDAKGAKPKNRKNAIKVISDILPFLHSVLPRQIGKWDDDYEPRAFGEQFQAMGFATILIEGGGILNGDGEKLRSFYFSAMLLSLQSIAYKSYKLAKVKMYKDLPKNENRHVHILISNIQLEKKVDIAINYTIRLSPKKKRLEKIFEIFAIEPNLSEKYAAYQYFNGAMLHIDKEIEPGTADFNLYMGDEILLGFEKGIQVKGVEI